MRPEMIEPAASERSRVLLVFPATSYRPDAYAAAARELNIELVAVTDAEAPARRLGLEVVLVDFAEDGAAPVDAALAGGFAGVRQADGIVAVDERSAIIAAQLAARGACRRPFHSVAGVLAAGDKGAMRRALAAAGVPTPVVRARVGKGESLPEVTFPVVVKPPRLSGSQGVIRADDEAAFARAIVRARSILHRHARARGADAGFFELVVEDYVDGAEVAVEGLMSDGKLAPIAIFDKPEPLVGPYFEETLYVTPSACAPGVQATLLATTEAAALALGLTDGPVHAELRLAPKAPQLIEIAARSIGGLCSRALLHVVGSLEARLLQHAVGASVPRPPAVDVASGVMMMPVPRSGVLRSVAGLDEARSLPGIDAVTVNVAVDEIVYAAPDGGSYLGFIFAHGATAEEVAEVLTAAFHRLHFELTPLLPLAPLGGGGAAG